MKDLIDLLGEPDTTVTVVGASDNPSKYGNVIYRDLRRRGFTVFAVSSVNGGRMIGAIAHSSLHQERRFILPGILSPVGQAQSTLVAGRGFRPPCDEGIVASAPSSKPCHKIAGCWGLAGHTSTTTSVLGLAQQINTDPSSGGSRGSRT